MRRITIVLIFMVWPVLAWPQRVDGPADRLAAVKSAIGTILGSEKKSAEIILNDLREFNGTIIGVYENHFVVVPAKKGLPKLEVTIISTGPKPPRQVVKINYGDVLQLSSKGVALSFVPDPASSPYSNWDAVRSIGRGEYLHLRTVGDKSMIGVYYRSSSDSISLMNGNREVEIPAAEVAKIYRIKGDSRRLGSKILTGGSRGKDMEPWVGDAAGRWDPIASLAGATMWMLPIGKTSRLLVYSK